MSQILYMFHAEDHTHSCLAHLWRLPWVWAVHCFPRKAPGQTSSKSELPRAPVPGSPGTGIPQSQIVSAEALQTNSQASELGKASKVGQIAPLSYPTRPFSEGSPRPTSCSEGVTSFLLPGPFLCRQRSTLRYRTTLLGDNYCAAHPADPSFPFAGSTSQTPLRQPPHRSSSETPLRLASICCPHPVQVYLPQPLHVTFRHMALNATGRKLKNGQWACLFELQRCQLQKLADWLVRFYILDHLFFKAPNFEACNFWPAGTAW